MRQRTWNRQRLHGKQRLLTFCVVTLLVSGIFAFETVREDMRGLKWHYLTSHVRARSLEASSPLLNGDPARSVPVLLYHSIVNENDPEEVSLDTFVDHMQTLATTGYYTITVADLNAFLRGKKELLGRPIVLTFDDGAKNSYYPVDPILKALNFKASTFIITRFSVLTTWHKYYLSLKTLKRMRDSGRWEILSHGRDDHVLYEIDEKGSKDHYLTNKLWLKAQKRLETNEEFKERVINDLRSSQKDLEDSLGTAVQYFAFPFGDYGYQSVNYKDVIPVISEAAHQVYDRAFYQVWINGEQSQNYRESSSWLLKRISVRPEWSGQDLLTLLEQGSAKSLPYRDEFTNNQGWRQTWGIAELTDSGLALKADVNTKGATAFLDGTAGWKDYSMQSTVELRGGGSLSLMARYHDNRNYVACVFSDGNVLIEEWRDNKETMIARKSVEVDFVDNRDFNVGIRVVGATIDCQLNNETVISATAPTARNIGGIGFKLWSPKNKEDKLIIQLVSVQNL